MSRELYFAFDPGHTTGFAAAMYDSERFTLEFVDLAPLHFGSKYPRIEFGYPPMDCFEEFINQVNTRIESIEDSANMSTPMFTAIEDFVGGSGGDIQNSVNKLIGILLVVMHEAGSDFPRLYKNSTRYTYLNSPNGVDALIASNPAKYGAISHHSRDAMGHLLHRFSANHPEWKDGVIKLL